jgi:hypothetical protein
MNKVCVFERVRERECPQAVWLVWKNELNHVPSLTNL